MITDEYEPIPDAPRVKCPWCIKAFTVDEVIAEKIMPFDKSLGYFYADGDFWYYLFCPYCEERFDIVRIRAKFEEIDGWGSLEGR
jgi:hypothetical protein